MKVYRILDTSGVQHLINLEMLVSIKALNDGKSTLYLLGDNNNIITISEDQTEVLINKLDRGK